MSELSNFLVKAASGIVTPTQVTITASEAFTQNDPVFIDWKTGDNVNLNLAPIAAALASGPSGAVLATDFPAATFRFGASAVGADGSLLVLAGASNFVSNITTSMIMAYKFNAKGALLSKTSILPLIADKAAGGLTAITLSNGNFAVAYAYGVSTTPTQNNWVILSPALKVLYTGSIGGVYGLGPSLHMQPTTNGGFLNLTAQGVTFVSAAGVMTPIYRFDGNSYFATQTELNSNGQVQESSASSGLVNYQPVPLSGGGYGYFIASTTNGLLHVQVNADGTARGAAINLNSVAGTLPEVQVARSSTGNILWIVTTGNNAQYGVISDSGAIVKASAALPVWTANYALGCIPDVNGNFLITAGASDSYKMLYLTSTGATLAGSATTIYANSGSLGAFFNMSKLTTGTVVVFGVQYDFYSAFISLTGAVTVTPIWKSTVGASFSKSATMIANDTVYGFYTAGATLPEMVVFSVSNTGSVNITPTFLAVAIVGSELLRVILDPSGKWFYICTGNLVITFDITTLTMIQSYTASLTYSHVRFFGNGLLYSNVASAYGRESTVSCGYLKLRPTVLLGVAANTVAAGEALVVNTKGMFTVSPAWKYAAQLFDQSANTPPGNAGYINNSVISLKGF